MRGVPRAARCMAQQTGIVDGRGEKKEPFGNKGTNHRKGLRKCRKDENSKERREEARGAHAPRFLPASFALADSSMGCDDTIAASTCTQCLPRFVFLSPPPPPSLSDALRLTVTTERESVESLLHTASGGTLRLVLGSLAVETARLLASRSQTAQLAVLHHGASDPERNREGEKTKERVSVIPTCDAIAAPVFINRRLRLPITLLSFRGCSGHANVRLCLTS